MCFCNVISATSLMLAAFNKRLHSSQMKGFICDCVHDAAGSAVLSQFVKAFKELSHAFSFIQDCVSFPAKRSPAIDSAAAHLGAIAGVRDAADQQCWSWSTALPVAAAVLLAEVMCRVLCSAVYHSTFGLDAQRSILAVRHRAAALSACLQQHRLRGI